MSYIKIQIGGKERGLKFNQWANETFWKMAKLETGSESLQVYATFYAGLGGNCIAKNEEIDFTVEQVQDWVDELYLSDEGKKIIQLVDKTYSDTSLYKVSLAKVIELIEKLNPKEDKKKERVKKSGLKSTA